MAKQKKVLQEDVAYTSYGASFFQAKSELVLRRFCMERINESRRLHEQKGTDGSTGCLLFVLDRRFVENEGGLELRLGVSFGVNPVSSNHPGGFLPTPCLPGKLVFGIHVVGTRNNRMALYDQFVDAREAGDSLDLDEALNRANSILRETADSDYAALASEDPDNPGPVKLSDRWLIHDFEIVPGESL